MTFKQILFLVTVLSSQLAFSQEYTVHRQKKFYLGISGGLNYSGVNPTEDYRVLETTPQSEGNDMDKDYEPLFKNRGSQYGLYFSYTFNRKISLVFNPSYYISSFNYRTAYSWRDTVNGSDFNLEMMHQQKIANITLPLMARYDFSILQFSPFVQGGIYTSFRRNAVKTIYYDNTIDEEVDKDKADQTGEADFTKHTNKANFGVIAGGGLTYFANYFAITLEANVRYGFGKVISDQYRYADYTGFTFQYLDVPDQLKLGQLDFQLTIMFPIDNSISLGILKKSRY